MRRRGLFWVVAFICLLAAACSRGGSAGGPGPEPGPVQAAALPYRPPAGPALEAERLRIQSQPVPEGLIAADYEPLRAALLSALEASRSASSPPDPGINVIDDLVITDLGGGAAALSWTYKNRGDYDLNGEVNISDLTPVGQHFGRSSAHPQWDAAQKADGDGNGEVNIADVTPIGQAYGAQCAAFNLYGSDSAEGPFGYLDSLPFASGDFGVFPPQFTWNLPVADKPFYLVAPADSEGFDNANAAEPRGAIFNPGTLTEVVQASLGAEGGSLDGPVASPLEGVHIDVPPGAFPGEVQLVLAEDSGTIGAGYGEWEAPILDVETGLTEMFDEPLAITMPYTGGDDYIPLPYYIDAAGRLDACQITAWDSVAGTVTFESWHSSRFTIIKAARQQKLPPAFATSWEPGLDGFQVNNQAGTYTGGNCWGMSAFSRWYWEKYSREGPEPVFFPEFMQIVNGEPAQQTIAMRAQLSLGRVFLRYRTAYLKGVTPGLDDEDTILILRSQLLNTQQPVLLYLVSDDQAATHAVLAYGYGQNSFKVYDPNSPGAPKAITFDELGFDPFVNFFNFTSVYYFGLGSLQTDPFEAILADAKAGFPPGEVPLDVIVAPQGGPGSSVVELYCYPDGAPDIIQWMRLTAVDQSSGTITTMQAAPYFGSDWFGFTVPVHSGKTAFWYETFARNGKGQLVKQFNSLENTPNLYTCADTPASILATLTWVSPDNRDDLRLVLIDPGGDVCWEKHGQTDDGAYQAIRYEPPGCIECIRLGRDGAAVTRWGQPYRFRVVNSGSVVDYDFVLSVSLNDQPAQDYYGHVGEQPDGFVWPPDPVSDTGPEWWDGPTVVPEQP